MLWQLGNISDIHTYTYSKIKENLLSLANSTKYTNRHPIMTKNGAHRDFIVISRQPLAHFYMF